MTDWLDSTKLETLQMCPQKYAWRFEENLRSTTDDKSALDFGFAIHAALEQLYRGDAFDTVECPLGPCAFCKGDGIPSMAATFLRNYPTDPDDPKNPRTRNRGIEMLHGYLSHWSVEPFKVLAVEVPFELAFGDFNYVGRMDLVVEWNGRILPLDHKTTSQFGHLFERQFKLSSQCSGYIQACSVVTGENVTEACINALRITSRISEESFFRTITSRTPDEIDRWKWEADAAMRRIREYRRDNMWPRNAPYSCVAYGKLCEYYQLCSTGPMAQATLKQTAYREEVWDPTPATAATTP